MLFEEGICRSFYRKASLNRKVSGQYDDDQYYHYGSTVLLHLNLNKKYHSYYCYDDDDDNHDRLNAGFGRSQGKFGEEDLKRIDLSQTIPLLQNNLVSDFIGHMMHMIPDPHIYLRLFTSLFVFVRKTNGQEEFRVLKPVSNHHCFQNQNPTIL